MGNLTQVTPPSGPVIEYLVDGRNRRIGVKEDGVVSRQWIYQDQLNPVAEFDGAGDLVSEFVYAAKTNVPSAIVRHDEFGVTSSGPVFQPFGFVGGLQDGETGFVRFGARDYDSATGRWTAKDPIGFKGDGRNFYGYVLSDSINAIDPRGLIGLVADQSTALTFRGLLSGLAIRNGQVVRAVFQKTIETDGVAKRIPSFSSAAPGASKANFCSAVAKLIKSPVASRAWIVACLVFVLSA